MQRLEHDEFGRVLFDSNPGLQPFGFGGGLMDVDTGLVRFGARDYEPVTGRWTARDPVRFAGGENGYLAAENDLINGVDPTGLLGVAIGIGICALGGCELAMTEIAALALACVMVADALMENATNWKCKKTADFMKGGVKHCEYDCEGPNGQRRDGITLNPPAKTGRRLSDIRYECPKPEDVASVQ